MRLSISRAFLFSLAIIAVIVAAVVYVFIVPNYSSSPSTSQIVLLKVQSETKGMRDAIADAIKNRHSIEQLRREVSLSQHGASKKYIEDIAMLQDGALAIKISVPLQGDNETRQVWVWLVPFQNGNGGIDWICVAYPKGLLPKQCD